MKNKISFKKALKLAKQQCNLENVRLIAKTEYYLNEEEWIDLYLNLVAICREAYDIDTEQSTNIWRVKQEYMNRSSNGSLRNCLYHAYCNINQHSDIN